LVSGDINKKHIKDCDGRITQLGLMNSNAKYLPVNSVMIALNGQGKTRGTVALLKVKATCNQSLVSIFPKDVKQLMPEYLYANLHGRYEEIRRITGDSGNDRRGLNMPLIRNIELPIPPLAEQKRIVAILDEAFEEIDRAIAHTKKNLANARELFDSYLNNVFTQKGDGWVEKKMGEVCVLQRGFDLPKRLRSAGEFPLVSSSGIIDFHAEAKVQGLGVVTGRSGSIGNVFFMEEDFWPLNTALYVKEFFGNHPKFIYYLLKKFNLKNYASGAGVPTLNRNHVHSEIIIIPENIEVQIEIVERLEELFYKTQQLESIYRKKLEALAELKQSLLQKAFAGELTAEPEASLKQEAMA